MRERGYRSSRALAAALGLHRNSLTGYLSGRSGLPRGLDRLLGQLDLHPGEAFLWTRRRRYEPALRLMPLIESLHDACTDAALVLFGSRARGNAKPFSDYDLGVYFSGESDFASYSRLLDLVAAWNEAELTTVQLVNLTRADANFLRNIRADLVFLAGSYKGWCELQRRAEITLHEG